MRVYKFLHSKWAAEAVRDQRLKISLLPMLNDPWEGRAIGFLKDSNRDTWEFMLGALSLKIGLTCFSKSWTNPVLWSHYSDSHKGIVLGFDILEHSASGEKIAMDVQYIKERPAFSLESGLDKLSTIEELKTALACKFDDWKYEDEVRYFLELSDVDRQTGHFFVDFNSNLKLKEIIFGARYDNFAQMAELVSYSRPDTGITCKKADLSKEHFAMVDDRGWFNPSI